MTEPEETHEGRCRGASGRGQELQRRSHGRSMIRSSYQNWLKVLQMLVSQMETDIMNSGSEGTVILFGTIFIDFILFSYHLFLELWSLVLLLLTLHPPKSFTHGVQNHLRPTGDNIAGTLLEL